MKKYSLIRNYKTSESDKSAFNIKNIWTEIPICNAFIFVLINVF